MLKRIFLVVAVVLSMLLGGCGGKCPVGERFVVDSNHCEKK
jgi:hypothetical protein